MTSARYSGPVKTSYKSPHTKMKLKRSGFLPGAGGSDLVSRHMEAHYRRVAMATSQVDTSPPISMLTSTKARSRARTRKGLQRSMLEIPVANSRRSSLRLMNYRGAKPSASFTSVCMLSRRCESDAGFASMIDSVSLESLHITGVETDSQTPVLEAADQTLLSLGGSHSEPTRNYEDLSDQCSQSTERRLKYKELLEFSLEQSQGRSWQLYHTRTGQQTASAKQKQKHTRYKGGQKSSPPWKPAFSPNSSRSNTPHYPSYSSAVHVGPSLASTHKPKASAAVALAGSQVSPENTNLKAAQTEAAITHGLPIGSDGNPISEVTTEGTDSGVVGERTSFTVGDAAKVRETPTKDDGQRLLKEEEDTLSSGLPTAWASGSSQHKRVDDESDHAVGSGGGSLQEAHGSGPVSSGSQPDSSPQCKQSGKEMLAEAEECGHHVMVVCKRSQEIKKSIELQIEETAYLNFIAGVTRDVLSRGTLSNAAMTLLFDSHIERHKHSLRKDIMMKKINSLMKQLGINHHT